VFLLFLVPVPLEVTLVLPSVDLLAFGSGMSFSLALFVPRFVDTVVFPAFAFLSACFFL